MNDVDSIEWEMTFQGNGEIGMSKGCKKYSVDLSAYSDGELDHEEIKTMEDHLESCEGCRDDLNRLKKLHSALTSLSRPPLGRRSILEDIKAKLKMDEEEEKGIHIC